jgi:hypothetical protein
VKYTPGNGVCQGWKSLFVVVVPELGMWVHLGFNGLLEVVYCGDIAVVVEMD